MYALQDMSYVILAGITAGKLNKFVNNVYPLMNRHLFELFCREYI